MKELLQCDVLGPFDEMLAEVTPQQVDRWQSKLDPAKDDKEPNLGTVHNLAARKLWALAQTLRSKAGELYARSCGSMNDIEEADLKQQSDRLKEYSDFASTLFWLQVQSDMGHWICDMGIRSGWMVVKVPPRPRGPEGFLKMITGGSVELE